MIGHIAIAIALPGFNDLGRSLTPIFLLMDHFRYRFPTFSDETEENLSIGGVKRKVRGRSSFISATVSNAS